MEQPTIKTVELVRRIRDVHYEQLKNKTRAERIAFYRAKAQSMHEKAQELPHAGHDMNLVEMPKVNTNTCRDQGY